MSKIHQRRLSRGGVLASARGEPRCELRDDGRAVARRTRQAEDAIQAPGRGRCRAHRGRLVLRAGLIGAVFLVGLASLPARLPANLAEPEPPLSDRLEVQHLAEVRERLERRRALQRNLQAQVDALAAELEALRAQHEKTSAMLQSERQEALVLEQRLDRLVPRFVARMAEVRERRAQAARALADLASKSRSPRLDPTFRARMLALSPLMLERLRHVENGLALLRKGPDQTIERHAQVERRLPELMTAHRRVQREREQNRLVRQVALDRLRGLAVEVKLLGNEQARLARRFLRDETATILSAEPQADQRALPHSAGQRGAPVQAALVDKGAVDPIAQLAHVADAWNRSASRVTAEAPKDTGHGSTEMAMAPPPAKPIMAALRSESPPVWPRASRDAVHRAPAPDIVFLPDGDRSGPKLARARGRQGTPPILAVPDAAQARGLVAYRRPELTVRVAPGQGVAAPVDGKVVFAGAFKSYGLLLILEHEREYHTLLWGFARLDVNRGDQVQVGQIVGIMNARGDDPPVLHVERRRNGRPVDLAASSNGIQG